MDTTPFPPTGFSLCFVKVCTLCSGNGFLGGYSALSVGGSLAKPDAGTPCTACVRGFQFAAMETDKLMNWVMTQLTSSHTHVEQLGTVLLSHMEFSPQLSQAFLKVMTATVERHVTERKPGA